MPLNEFFIDICQLFHIFCINCILFTSHSNFICLFLWNILNFLFMSKNTLKHARSVFPLGKLIINPDYYGFSGVPCPRTGNNEICHDGNGNIGFKCKFYGGFYAGDQGITICLFVLPIQLELF